MINVYLIYMFFFHKCLCTGYTIIWTDIHNAQSLEINFIYLVFILLGLPHISCCTFPYVCSCHCDKCSAIDRLRSTCHNWSSCITFLIRLVNGNVCLPSQSPMKSSVLSENTITPPYSFSFTYSALYARLRSLSNDIHS